MSYCDNLFLGQYGISLNLQKTFSPYHIISKLDKKSKANLKSEKIRVVKSKNIFKHSLSDHASYGVTFDTNENGDIIQSKVKMFTYPSVESVEIQFCHDCEDSFLNDYKTEDYDKTLVRKCLLDNDGNGIFQKIGISIQPGDRYRFKLNFSDDTYRYISDLYSYEQNSILGWPVAYNQQAYRHSILGEKLAAYSEEWQNGLIYGKVNNFKAQNYSNYIFSNQLRLMQIHIGTFTKNGTFDSAIEKIDGVKTMGFNGVELMPHGYFYDKNWGYDPSFVFAAQYGGTDDFKKFCDYSHKCGLNVIVDLVNNHYSMDCPEIMTDAGPYENPDPRMHLKFGPRLNYNAANDEEVREWRINEALYWLKYADGIRFDLTDYTASGGFNTQLNIEIQEHFPGAVTFAESSSKEASSPLPENAVIKDLAESSKRAKLHDEIINLAQNDYWGDEHQGYTHRWHFDWSHAIENSMLNSEDRNIDYLKSQIFDAQKHMKIFLSHDEIGKPESDGNSPIVKILLANLFGFDFCNINWNSSSEKLMRYQKASRGIRELTRRYLTGEKWPNLDTQLLEEKAPNGQDINDIYSDFYGIADYENGGFSFGELGFGNGISPEHFSKLFESSCSLYKAGLGFLFSQPGPKMVFQNFCKPENRFSFFRKNSPEFYSDGAKKYNLKSEIDWETQSKGHAINSDIIINEANLEDLIKKYSSKAINLQEHIKNLIIDLNKIADKNSALSSGEVKNVIGNHKNAVAVHTKFKDNEIYAITHFDIENDYDDYKIYFPEGIWSEILNTNSKKYGGNGKYTNSEVTGDRKVSVKLPAASTIIFKRIG